MGRSRELDELSQILVGARLLTLTGIGGSGKTRLALRLAAAASGDYPEGIWLVALGPILEEGLLSQAVASASGRANRSINRWRGICETGRRSSSWTAASISSMRVRGSSSSFSAPVGS